MTLIALPQFLIPYALYLNVALACLLAVMYLISIRLIGTRWARWQWDVWHDTLISTSSESDGPLSWWLLFPGMGFQGKIGEHIPTRFLRKPRHWLAPMVAIAVTRWNGGGGVTDGQYARRMRSKRFALQMQAIFWAPSLAWNLAVLGAIVIGTIVWMFVWNGLLGLPRFCIRVITCTRDQNLAEAPSTGTMIRDDS